MFQIATRTQRVSGNAPVKTYGPHDSPEPWNPNRAFGNLSDVCCFCVFSLISLFVGVEKIFWSGSREDPCTSIRGPPAQRPAKRPFRGFPRLTDEARPWPGAQIGGVPPGGSGEPDWGRLRIDFTYQ